MAVAPCDLCASRGLTADECRRKADDDVNLLNASQVHIVPRPRNISTETIHALASICRVWIDKR